MGPLRGLHKTKFEVGASFYITHHFKLINLSFSAVFNSLSFLVYIMASFFLFTHRINSLLLFVLAGINVLTCTCQRTRKSLSTSAVNVTRHKFEPHHQHVLL